jgi:hypothetical protein
MERKYTRTIRGHEYTFLAYRTRAAARRAVNGVYGR